MDALVKAAVEAGIRRSWVVHLLLAEWWIERKRPALVGRSSRADHLGAA